MKEKIAFYRSGIKHINPQKITPVVLSSAKLVKIARLRSDSELPLLIQSTDSNLDLSDWISSNLDYIETNLMKFGGILFRNFSIKKQTDFLQILKSTSVELMNYLEGATPRIELGDKIYTSTEYPASQSIALHNELSIAANFPLKIWFFCLQPSEKGGATPICDVRKVYQQLNPQLIKRFIERKWMLVRNYGNGFGLSWQASFHTNSKQVVESYCRENAIEFEWKSNNRLRTFQVRPAIVKHPKTGETAWFNHIAFWHISTLESELRKMLLMNFQEEDLPYNTYYGDGSSIDASVIDEICQSYKKETVYFSWQKGDLLMLDNVLVAHGRDSFSGNRKVLTAMGEAYRRRDI